MAKRTPEEETIKEQIEDAAETAEEIAGPDKDEPKAEIEETRDMAEEIAGPEIDAAAVASGPDEVWIEYCDGRREKTSKQLAKRLVVRGKAKVIHQREQDDDRNDDNEKG